MKKSKIYPVQEVPYEIKRRSETGRKEETPKEPERKEGGEKGQER
jgi:hypothetical protein